MTYSQVTGDLKVGFELGHQELTLKNHFRAKRDCTADEIVPAFVEYSIGSKD